MSRRKGTDVIWQDGKPRRPPTSDEDLARQLARNPKALLDGPPLEWLKRKLEMEPPEFLGSDLQPSCCQELYDAVTGQTIIGPGGVEVPDIYKPLVSFQTATGYTGSSIVHNGICTVMDGVLHSPSLTDYHGSTAAPIPIGHMKANYNAGWGLSFQWSAVGGAISGIGLYYRKVGTTSWNGFGGVSIVDDPAWIGPSYGGGFNWIGSSWSSPVLYKQATAWPSEPFSFADPDIAAEFEVAFYVCNSSGFSDGSLTQLAYAIGWQHRSLIPDSVYTLPAGASENSRESLQWNGTGWDAVNSLDANARLGVRVNSAGSEYKRRRLNVIPGSSKLSVSHADDSANEEVDLTLDVVPANISVTGLSFPGGSTFLRADGTFQTINNKGRLTAYWNGTPAAGSSRYVVVPRGASDVDITIDLERLHFRLDVPASSGTTTAILQKATGGGAPAWTDVATISITAGNYEATDQTIGAFTVTSDDLLRLYFTAVGTGADGYDAIVTGTEV